MTDEEIENIKLTKINDSCIYIFQGNNNISTKFKYDDGENIYSRTEFEFRFLLIPVDEITSDFQSKFLSYGSKNDDFKYFLKSYNLKNNLDSFICYFVNKFYINDIGEQIRDIKRTDYFKDPDFEIKKLLNTSLAEYIKE